MPLDGNGTYTPPEPEYPAVPNTTILSSDWNTVTNDIAIALSTALYRDGQVEATNDIGWGNNKLYNLAPGVANTDATNFDQVFHNPNFVGSIGAGVVISGTKGTVNATLFEVNAPTLDINAATTVTIDSPLFTVTATNDIILDAADDIILDAVDDLNFIATDIIATSSTHTITAATITLAGATTASLESASTGVTQIVTDNSNKLATTAYVNQVAFTAGIPVGAGNNHKMLWQDSSIVEWSNIIDTDVMSLVDGADITKKVVLELSGINTATTRTVAIPNANTTLVGDDSNQTLSNKTIVQNDSLFQLFANGAPTKQALFNLSAITAGQTRTISVSDQNIILTTPGKILLETFTASGSSTTFNIEPVIFDATYDLYEIELEGLTFATNAVAAGIRFKVGGVYLTTSYYQAAQVGVSASISNGAEGRLTDVVSNAAAAAIHVTFKIPRPSGTTYNKSLYFTGVDTQVSAGANTLSSSIINSNTGALQGIQVKSGSGNILTGIARVYGIRKA